MRNLTITTLLALAAAQTFAMPTKAELKKAQPLVVELMAPAMAKYKSAPYKEKAAAAAKVGDASAEFAKAAETEAAKFLLLKGAVSFYARGEQYDKARTVLLVTHEQTRRTIRPGVRVSHAHYGSGAAGCREICYNSDRMNDRIEINPNICHGYPVIRGTRVPVSQILGALSGGDSIDDILTDYPSITSEDISAVFAFAGSLARFEDIPYQPAFA